jgi:hypothetical protein
MEGHPVPAARAGKSWTHPFDYTKYQKKRGLCVLKEWRWCCGKCYQETEEEDAQAQTQEVAGPHPSSKKEEVIMITPSAFSTHQRRRRL